MSNELSLLKNKAKEIDHVKTNLFHKNRKQCKFKEELKQCLAMLAQTNVSGHVAYCSNSARDTRH